MKEYPDFISPRTDGKQKSKIANKNAFC